VDRLLKLETRKEYKFIFSNNQINQIFSQFNSKLKILHPQRTIESIYLDTIDFELYKKSIFLDVDKFKVRYRKYPDSSDIYFEAKHNTKNGKFKEKILSELNSFDEIKNVLYRGYHLEKSLVVSYLRSYYFFRNLRITIDQNLSFKGTKNRLQNNFEQKYDKNIVEYKLLNEDSDIEKYFLSNPVKFSKYDYGIEKIYNI
tara:strand:- start:2929 stop:3528 length:600 start_codon:yes stop_codon:yes gene_type:complete